MVKADSGGRNQANTGSARGSGSWYAPALAVLAGIMALLLALWTPMTGKIMVGAALLFSIGCLVSAIRRDRPLAFPWLAAIVNTLALVLSFSAALPANGRISSGTVEIIGHEPNAAPRSVPAEEWVDARQFAHKRGDLVIRVVDVRSYGPANNGFIAVHLRMANLGKKPIPYRGWGGLDRPDPMHVPQSIDSADCALPFCFQRRQDLRPGTFNLMLKAGGELHETLHFKRSGQNNSALRLELPASAVGLTGHARWEIPAAMIH